MPRRVRHQDLSLDYGCTIKIYTQTRLVLWRYHGTITQLKSFTLICSRLKKRRQQFHSILDYLGRGGGSDSVGSTAGLSLYRYYLWPFCGSSDSWSGSVGSTAGLSLYNHYSGLSVAQQLLVTLYPSLRPTLSVVLEVDSYDDSQGRGGHVQRISR